MWGKKITAETKQNEHQSTKSLYLFFKIYFSVEDNCFMMLRWFLPFQQHKSAIRAYTLHAYEKYLVSSQEKRKRETLLGKGKGLLGRK